MVSAVHPTLAPSLSVCHNRQLIALDPSAQLAIDAPDPRPPANVSLDALTAEKIETECKNH